METQDILNKPIGTKEVNVLKPAKVKILEISLKEKTNAGEKMKVPLAEIMCQHPDKEDPIALTKIKCVKNDKLIVLGTWVQLDEDENISKSSAIASLLNFLSVNNIQEIVGKEVEAIAQGDNDPYLCIKAY